MPSRPTRPFRRALCRAWRWRPIRGFVHTCPATIQLAVFWHLQVEKKRVAKLHHWGWISVESVTGLELLIIDRHTKHAPFQLITVKSIELSNLIKGFATSPRPLQIPLPSATSSRRRQTISRWSGWFLQFQFNQSQFNLSSDLVFCLMQFDYCTGHENKPSENAPPSSTNTTATSVANNVKPNAQITTSQGQDQNHFSLEVPFESDKLRPVNNNIISWYTFFHPLPSFTTQT